MLGGRLAACAIGLAAVGACTVHPGTGHAATAPSALVVFLDSGGTRPPTGAGLSLGLVSAAQQAGYSRSQFLLDVTQGARIGLPGYSPRLPPTVRLTASSAGAAKGSGAGASARDRARARGAAAGGPARVAGWPAARRRAAGAEARLQPGLLAAAVPGGGAYAGPAAGDALDAVIAAGADGQIAAVALGGDSGLLERVAALRRGHRLVVADLPPGAPGRAALRRLASARAPGEILVALERARSGGDGELLWVAIAGLDGSAPGELESPSTQQRGVISAVDLAPTVLRHLGARVPEAMQGRDVVARGRLDTAALGRLRARLDAIPGRRLPALAVLLAAWAVLVLACARGPRARGPVTLHGARRALPGRAAGERTDGQTGRRALRRAVRTGALGILWAPCAALVAAAIEPGPGAEYALVAALALGLGAASDALLSWPRALIAPAAALPVAIAVDALAGTQLLMRSLAGPDPAGGARFYGVGNELKSALAVMALAGIAAGLYPLQRNERRRAGVALAASGLALLIVEGWARIGAGAGGAVLVSAGFALAAAVVLAPGRPTRLRGLAAIAGAAGGLALLIAIDLLTARGRGHLQGTVLDARSLADLRDEVTNRYATAWRALRDPGMAVAASAALALAVAGVRLRARLLAPVAGDRLFAAAFAGGLLAGACGALVEDSGPLLLVEAVLALVCVAAYLHAQPPPRRPRTHADRDESAYASSSAAPSPSADRPTIAVLGGSQGTA